VLPEATVGGVLLVYLLTFFALNAHNVIMGRRERRNTRAYAELRRPKGFLTTIAVLGTLSFFGESLLYVFLGLSGLGSRLRVALFQLAIPFDSYLQALGLLVMGAGFLLFLWSVSARGRYSVSWEMPDDHRLVTWGPYRYVRHPSYLGYFLMFAGLLLTWLNLLAAIPLMAIPGYVGIADVEEEMLTKRFGDEYRRYQSASGRFLPRLTFKRG
jgi:protein-S-isoprenylcysteine O-methyltransferase Ste14